MNDTASPATPGGIRALTALSGLGMILASVFTIRHYFEAIFPESIAEGSGCSASAFFSCDTFSYSPVAEIGGVPLGYFWLMLGGLVVLGTLFPSPALERTNKTLSALNALGVLALFAYSLAVLGSLCLWCSLYYVSSLAAFFLYWNYGVDRNVGGVRQFLRPSPLHLGTFVVVTLVGAYGFARFHEAKEQAQTSGVATGIVQQFFDLPTVPWPSVISPYYTIRSTERFEDAPVRIVEYGDLLCPDCRFFATQLRRLEKEFPGKINAVFQFFPLEARCNQVVEKDLHPGACDVSYMAAYDPGKFRAIHDEIFDTWPAVKDREWQMELGRRFGVTAALTDTATQALVHRLLNTGMEYEKTSEEYAYGIRSTPTVIINNRMIIGTLPYEQLRAIVAALIREAEGGPRFLESWVETR